MTITHRERFVKLFSPRDYQSDWILLQTERIPKTGPVYMKRLVIFRTPLFGMQLQRLYRADADRDLHDHPRVFLSVLLRGTYIEQYARGVYRDHHLYTLGRVRLGGLPKFLGVVRYNWMPLDKAHRIDTLHRRKDSGPVWSLLFVGPRHRVWGFYTDDGFVPWQEYVK